MSAAFNSFNSLSVGASGAVMGTAGALLGLIFLNWKTLSTINKIIRRVLLFSALLVIILDVLLMLHSIFLPTLGPNNQINVDHFGHFGGFLTGVFVAMLIGGTTGKQEYRKFETIVRVIGFLLFVALQAFLLYYLWYLK